MTKWLKRICFILYLLILFRITVFRSGWYADPFFCGEIELIPFQKIFGYLFNGRWFDFVYLFFGNILWFVPFGFICGAKKQGLWKTVLWTFLLSLTIEVLQFVFSSGYSDVEDLILNTLGGVIGFLLYPLIIKEKSDRA